MSDYTPRTDRREMFRSSLRYLALGGIGWAAAVGIRHAVSSPSTAGCSLTLPCGQCGAMSDCSLPAALAAKKNTADEFAPDSPRPLAGEGPGVRAYDDSPRPLAGEGPGVSCPTTAKTDASR